MATQTVRLAQGKSTPYDEFNMPIPRETFPAEGMTPRAAQAIVNSLRIVVRSHMNLTLMDTLANDIVQACQYLEKHGGTATPPQLHSAHQSAPKC